jgi:predicted O-methyltransferase YrrM
MRVRSGERRSTRAASLAKQAFSRRLPPRVAWFYLRAILVATRSHDSFSFAMATWPGDLAEILETFQGARNVVEIGTATGWTSIALALAEPTRQVHTYDPVDRPARRRYLELVPEPVRRRILFHAQAAAETAELDAPADALFLDSSHELDETLASYRHWAPRLTGDAIVAFHDFDPKEFPDVVTAIGRLGLSGRQRGRLFLWSPAGT